MENYRKAFTEVDTILGYLNQEEYSKIPEIKLEVIRKNKDENYIYELDENKELTEQKMLPETKAILFNLFRDYLSIPGQKEKIIKMQRKERWQNEEKKKQIYGNVDIFKKINN